MRQKNIGPSECDFAGTDLKKTNRTNNPDASISDPPDMLTAALDRARSGWAVFPCQPSGEHAKAPYKGTRGHLDATTHPGIIRHWWARWPDAMIGAPVPPGLLVLDVDPRNGGSLDALVSVVGELPPTVTVWSGREDGGRHLYFRVNPNLPKLTSTRLPAGVDLKVNGYCILPPSLHPATGTPYRWEGSQFAVLPVRALQALLPPPPPPRTHKPGTGNGSGLVRTVAEAVEGNRNSSLYWSARTAAEDGILDQIRDDLYNAALAAGETPTKARATIRSGEEAGNR